VAILLLLPALQVTWVRFVNPSITPLMLLRPLEMRLDGKPSAPRRYEWCDDSRIPAAFFRCLLASEDQRFYQHRGFDWREMQIAQAEAERRGRPPRGASTITMQCARSLFLWQGRSFIRKGLEAYYTVWMELLLSKRRILALYANIVEMGDGIYGVEAASKTYFGSGAQTLTRERSALIVACLPNPRVRDPRNPSAVVTSRTNRILIQERTLKIGRGD
jgi:monofunctional biosynthetic peptidoglycan transglycosylase